MSLESKIDALTVALEALTARIGQIPTTSTTSSTSATPAKPDVQPVATVAPATPIKKQSAAPIKEELPSVDDLQAMAMAKVRNDRGTKTAIKDLIASYDGAKVISDIPPANRKEFAEKLAAV